MNILQFSKVFTCFLLHIQNVKINISLNGITHIQLAESLTMEQLTILDSILRQPSNSQFNAMLGRISDLILRKKGNVYFFYFF